MKPAGTEARGMQQASAVTLVACGLLLAAIVLSGCTAVGPKYVKPKLPVPDAWTRATTSGSLATQGHPEDLSHWWRQLGDPVLSGLIERALAASPDMRSARAKLREARARRKLAGAEHFPTVTGSASISLSKTGGTATYDLYSAGFDASWEPDVFGATRRGVEAAQADLEAAGASLHDTQVSLAAEVAVNYVELRGYQGRLKIARENLASQTETLDLTSWRAEAGLTSSLDVEQARANREQTHAQIPSLETGLAEAEHRLAILLGLTPAGLHHELAAEAPIPSIPQQVAVGIPADTLRQRPDVRAAERTLAAETARLGKAVAARYPSFSLSGSFGLSALSFGALASSDAVSRSLLTSLTAPIFDRGRIRQQIEIQNAVQEQALVSYETVVLTALKDVEDALVSLANSRLRQEALTQAAEAARNAALLARHRYTVGITDFQTVLDTERTVLTLEDSLVSTQADGTTALVQLYKALGGGWSPDVAGAPQKGHSK